MKQPRWSTSAAKPQSSVGGTRDPVANTAAGGAAASKAVCAALPHALAFELQTHPTVVADGAWLLPEFAAQLDLEDVSIRSVFLHESDPEHVARAMSSRRGVTMVAAWHAESARLAWLYGNWLADQAGRVALPVVSSRPYATAADRLLALT